MPTHERPFNALPPEILTLGHSNHPIEHFVGLLTQHGVAVLADVRSVPYSRRHPAYKREALAATLAAAGIAYVFLGRELGAKSPDPSHYVDGRVSYARLAATALFADGLARLAEHARAQRTAIMCAEKEPLECHRTLLVSRALAAAGVGVTHILADGRLESHADAMRRMRALVGVAESDLLRTQTELDDEAYARQERRIAYVQPAAALAPQGPSA
jgi:uncharacterized protein (DUF488 family)